MGGAEGLDSTQLVLHEGLDLLGGASHVAATEADQIGMTGVGTDGNTGSLGGGNGLIHDQRIAGMIAASNVGGRDVGDNGLVHTDGISAEALTQIAVQVYFVHFVSLLTIIRVLRWHSIVPAAAVVFTVSGEEQFVMHWYFIILNR